MAGLTVLQGCNNVFKQLPRYLSGNRLKFSAIAVNSYGLEQFNPVSIQQIRYKTMKVRFKDQKAGKDKTYTFQRKKSSIKKLKKKEETPEFLARKPVDNMWIRQYYPLQTETFEGAISKHKEFADPMMLNNMDGLIYADMQLDTRTKKKTKFLANVKGTILFDHKFDAGPPARCLVLSENEEDVEKALALGAAFAGGSELLAQLKQEAITRSMYDHVMCTPGIFPELVAFRPIFKERIPNQKRGNMGTDVEAMLNTFMSGVSYESKKIYEGVGSLQVPIGQLHMSEEHLLINFQTLVAKICQGKNTKLGPFITEINLIAPPSPEKFQLTAALYVPGYDVPVIKEIPSEEEIPDDDDEIVEKNALQS